MTYQPAPPSSEVAHFLETEDLSILEKSLDFGMSEKFVSFYRCKGACVGAFVLPLFYHPVLCFNGGSLAKHFSLKLTRDTLVLTSARNDLALHIAEKQVVIPLAQVQDVELEESALLAPFGLKKLNVWTGAGRTRGGRHNRAPEADITAVFLPDPDQAFAAIQLAVRLYKQQQQRAALAAAVAAAGVGAAGINHYTPEAAVAAPGIAVA